MESPALRRGPLRCGGDATLRILLENLRRGAVTSFAHQRADEARQRQGVTPCRAAVPTFELFVLDGHTSLSKRARDLASSELEPVLVAVTGIDDREPKRTERVVRSCDAHEGIVLSPT
jgi:hypothetical protein